MPNDFPENDDSDEMNYDHQEIPFLAVNFVQQVDELVSFAHYGPSIVLVSGEDGVGKSTIIEQLDNEINDLGVIRIDGTPMLGVDQLHASCLQQLNSYDQAVEFNSVRDTLIRAAEEIDQIIIVDDAQQLSTSVLETLLSLVAPVEQAPTNLVRLFLFGNADLEKQINTSAYPQAAIYKLNLKGLNKDEITSFLGHVLNLSDANVEDNYSKKYINLLWKKSRGNPGKLISNLNQAENEDDFVDDENNWSGIVFRVILTILGVGLLALAIFGEGWLPSSNESAAEDEKATAVVIAEEQKNNQQEDIKTPIESIELVESEEASIEVVMEERPLVSVELENSSVEEALEKELAEETASELIPKIVEKSSIEELNLTDNSSEIVEQETDKTIEANMVSSELVVVEKEPALNNNAEIIRVIDFTEAEQKLLDVPVEHYSIQLVGLSKREDIEKFVESLSAEQETYIYRSLLNGQPWFILVTGDYIDADTARIEKDKLQASMKKLRPWIKSFSVIQQQIQEASLNRQ